MAKNSLCKNVFGRKLCRRSAMRSRILLEVPKLCADLDRTLLYILILQTYTKFVCKNKMLALGVCITQPCSSAGRKLTHCNTLQHTATHCNTLQITFTVLPTNRFVCTTKNSMKCVVNWIPLRIRVRSRITQPHLHLPCRKTAS